MRLQLEVFKREAMCGQDEFVSIYVPEGAGGDWRDLGKGEQLHNQHKHKWTLFFKILQGIHFGSLPYYRFPWSIVWSRFQHVCRFLKLILHDAASTNHLPGWAVTSRGPCKRCRLSWLSTFSGNGAAASWQRSEVTKLPSLLQCPCQHQRKSIRSTGSSMQWECIEMHWVYQLVSWNQICSFCSAG